ncbi:MAG: 4Fe-4S binding protein [Chloroflexi bacterium]|nr:4Fe-4S binding protein [Chloroflexota bacterium]
MNTAARPEAAVGRDRSLSVFVLYCSHLARWVAPNGAHELARTLAAGGHFVRASEAAGLCERPVALPRAGSTSDTRLVLAVCAGRITRPNVEVYARRAGFEPFGVQIVEVQTEALDGGAPGAAPAPGTLLRRLRAAMMRAAAYPGSEPENSRATIAREGLALTRRELFTLPPVRYAVAPTIDGSRCRAAEGCDACVGSCPSGAISRREDRIAVERSSCASCASCLGVCPERAVSLPGLSAAEVEAEVAALFRDPAHEPGAVVYICREASIAAPSGWYPVRVACVNTLPVAGILRPFTLGAQAVALAACGPSCADQSPARALENADYCRQLLEALGDPAPRVFCLGTRDLPPIPPGRARTALDGRQNSRPAVYGKKAAADAIRALAARLNSTPRPFDHPRSPVGLASVDAAVCTVCETCAGVCPTAALRVETSGNRTSLFFDPELCSGCGECMGACPERAAGAIRSSRVTDVAELIAGERLVASAPQAICTRCGTPFANERLLQRVNALLGNGEGSTPCGRMCASCRSGTWSRG